MYKKFNFNDIFYEERSKCYDNLQFKIHYVHIYQTSLGFNHEMPFWLICKDERRIYRLFVRS